MNSARNKNKALEPIMEILSIQAEHLDSTSYEEFQEFESTMMDGLDKNETFDNEKLVELCKK